MGQLATPSRTRAFLPKAAGLDPGVRRDARSDHHLPLSPHRAGCCGHVSSREGSFACRRLPTAPPAPDALNDPALVPLFEQDRTLVKLGRDIRVLKAIDWPLDLEQRFLAGWRVGRPRIAGAADAAAAASKREIEGLDDLIGRIDRGHPLGMWLYKSAWSYRVAAQMLGAIGTPEFTRCSALLYGRPDHLYPSQDSTNADVARELLRVTDELINDRLLPEIPATSRRPSSRGACASASIRSSITTRSRSCSIRTWPPRPPPAASGSRCARRRCSPSATWSSCSSTKPSSTPLTAAQRQAPALPDLAGLRRAAHHARAGRPGDVLRDHHRRDRHRPPAPHRAARGDGRAALEGADFIEVFRGFLDAGQTEVESYRSAARIFRGGDVRGRVCFTKDGAYLEGVLRIYAFICKALQEGRGELLPLLFCRPRHGRRHGGARALSATTA